MTTLDDASAESCWRPILSGTTAQQALQAVGAIADSLTSISSPPGQRDPSLGKGQSGLALLYTWLARTGRTPQAEVLARQCLDRAVEAVSTQAMNASLWGGFTGVAWAAELVDRLLDAEEDDRSEAVDDALLRLLSRADRWPAPYDLVVGLTGVGVYALQRYPRPVAIECLRRVVELLHECARHDEHGLYWWTPPTEILDQEDRKLYPSGRVDLGVAHGVAGPIALLGSICGAGAELATARPLLDGAVRWLLAHSVATEAGPTFPVWVAPSFQPSPARCAWCYGDPGIAAALLMAARGVDDAGWEQAAVALACRAAERPASETGVVNASFCHGAAGLAHLYNRMYQATGEPKLGRAALYWLERTLDFYRLAKDNGGSWVRGSWDPGQRERWTWTGIDVVDGAAGVALVLLAAATSVEPTWDGMFLVSAPTPDPGTPDD
ncbi:lanthionine synthetase C family protein [Pseudonocardia sp.]|uniref:lanthionine synthetase C family protein n=1 Tax=Pseudonocardia sp. TaxID=60912 RepID=UPI0031FE4051